MSEAVPHRGDEVATWLKAQRDATGKTEEGNIWYALDALLNDYRDHADTGTPLSLEIVGPDWGESELSPEFLNGPAVEDVLDPPHPDEIGEVPGE